MDALVLEALKEAGIGGDRHTIELQRTSDEWLAAGAALRDRVATVLSDTVSDVRTVGSSSVRGLMAKPIIDIAVGLSTGQSLASVTEHLEADGWIYRGDAGDNGGHVFVLESRPGYRLGHVHVVEYQGSQWENYLRFQSLLRQSPEARRQYEAVKIKLVQQDHTDMTAYTTGKSDVVALLLEGQRFQAR